MTEIDDPLLRTLNRPTAGSKVCVRLGFDESVNQQRIDVVHERIVQLGGCVEGVGGSWIRAVLTEETLVRVAVEEDVTEVRSVRQNEIPA